MNTDGSYMEGKSKAGIGGILRNEAGDLIVAFSIPVHYSSNNMAEALAAKAGIQKTYNAKLRKIIEDTTQILDQAIVRISHCYMEASQVVDALAKHATTLENANFFDSFQQLPRGAKGPFQLD